MPPAPEAEPGMHRSACVLRRSLVQADSLHPRPHGTVKGLIKHLNLDFIGYLLCAKNSKLLFINDIIIRI